MVTPEASRPLVAPSPLDLLVRKHSSGTQQAESTLALQVAHNLRYQHNWTDLRLHRPGAASRNESRCMISGYPPQRLYVHPDEQIELLQKQKDAGKTGMPALSADREWVLPTRLRDKWSLKKFGDVFDAISVIPQGDEGESIFAEAADPRPDGDEKRAPVEGLVSNDERNLESSSDWRSRLPKRILLATVDDDSTVVYYIVHDGIVKPRQN